MTSKSKSVPCAEQHGTQRDAPTAGAEQQPLANSTTSRRRVADVRRFVLGLRAVRSPPSPHHLNDKHASEKARAFCRGAQRRSCAQCHRNECTFSEECRTSTRCVQPEKWHHSAKQRSVRPPATQRGGTTQLRRRGGGRSGGGGRTHRGRSCRRVEKTESKNAASPRTQQPMSQSQIAPPYRSGGPSHPLATQHPQTCQLEGQSVQRGLGRALRAARTRPCCSPARSI